MHAAYTTAQWHRFVRLIGREDLVADAALANPVIRNLQIEELYAVVAAAAPGRTAAEWMDALLKAKIMFGEVMSPEQLIDNPHLAAAGMFPEVEHPTEGTTRTIGFPTRSSTGATRLSRLAPTLGQDSREVLAEAGVPGAEIKAMVQAGQVIAG